MQTPPGPVPPGLPWLVGKRSSCNTRNWEAPANWHSSFTVRTLLRSARAARMVLNRAPALSVATFLARREAFFEKAFCCWSICWSTGSPATCTLRPCPPVPLVPYCLSDARRPGCLREATPMTWPPNTLGGVVDPLKAQDFRVAAHCGRQPFRCSRSRMLSCKQEYKRCYPEWPAVCKDSL